MFANFIESKKVIKQAERDGTIEDKVTSIAVVQKPLDLKLTEAYFYHDAVYGKMVGQMEGKFYAVNTEDYSSVRDIETALTMLGMSRLNGWIGKVELPEVVKNYVNKMLCRKIEEIGAYADAKAGAKMNTKELEAIKGLMDQSHDLIALDDEYSAEFKALYADVLAGGKNRAAPEECLGE